MAKLIRPQERVRKVPGGLSGESVRATTGAVGATRVTESLGRSLQDSGTKLVEQSNKAFQSSLYSKAMGQATLEFNQAYQQRSEQLRDEEGNPTFGTLTSDVSRIGSEVMAKHANGIFNPEVRQQFEQSFQSQVYNKQIQSQSLARSQQLQFTRDNVYGGIESLSNSAKTDDMINSDDYISKVNTIVDDALANGVVSPAEATKLKDSTEKNIRGFHIAQFIDKAPNDALVALQQKTPDELGLTPEQHQSAIKQAERQVDFNARKQKQVDNEEKAKLKQQQINRYSELQTDLARGTLSEASVMREMEQDKISFSQGQKLIRDVLKQDSKILSAQRVGLEIDKSITSGEPLYRFSTKQVGDHYMKQVKVAEQGGEPLSLLDKAKLAQRYNGAVAPFSKEVSAYITGSDDGKAIEAMEAFSHVAKTQPEAVSSNIDPKSRAMANVYNSFVSSTGMSPNDALAMARNSVIEADDVVRRERSKQFRSARTRKDGELSLDIIKSELADAFDQRLGPGGEPNIPDDVINRIMPVLEQSYIATGDANSALATTTQYMQSLYGVSAINGDDELLLFPPEKLIGGGATSEDIRNSMIAEIDPSVLPSGIVPKDIIVRSDALTDPRKGLSYGLYYRDNEGFLRPVGDGLRWTPDLTAIKEAQIEKSLQQRKERFDVQSGRGWQAEFMDNLRHPNRPKPSMEPMKVNIPKSKTASAEAITGAGDSVGVDSNVLLAIAKAESNFNPNAKNKSSSASGLFQFIDSTWANMVDKYGEQYGVGMGDRMNPGANALMGALHTRDNAQSLKSVLNREPNVRELYLAHFSGVDKAKEVLAQLQKDPDVPASAVYSKQEIRSNPSIFKQGGKVRTLRDSYLRLTNKVAEKR